MYFNIYSIPLYVSCLIVCVLLYYIIKDYKSTPGSKYIGMLLSSIAFYSFFYAFEISSDTLPTLLFFYKLEYLGVAFIPLFFLLFIIDYSGRKNWFPKKLLVFFVSISTTTLLLVLTTEYHTLYHKVDYIQYGGLFPVLGYQPGIWYWVHFTYANFCIILGLSMLFSVLQGTLPVFRKQIMIVIVGSLMPFATLLIHLSGMSPWGIDPAPFSLTLSAIIIFIGFTRYKLFNLTPLARGLLFEHLPDSVVVFDKEQRIVDYNNSAMQKSNIGLKDVGMRVSELSEPWCGILNRKPDSSTTSIIEINETINEKLFWLNITFLPIHDKRGNTMGQMVIISDITQRKIAEEELRAATEKANYLAEKAESASTAKSAFLANMSHELRTPLNSIIGFSDILLENTFGPLNPKQTRYVGNVSRSGKHLLSVINDILDISKIEAGKMELTIEAISIMDAIDEVVGSCYSLASKKNIDLVKNVESKLQNIKVDKVKLEQILFNLVSNAIKFSDEGGVVNLNVKSGTSKVTFEVTDKGPGISNEDQNKLFTVFGQLDNAHNRKYEGTGLGLAIVKRLVEMHNGTVWVESEPGKGSTFGFDLPVE
ncbi:PAS domain S-box [Methanolobus tindarius DSM 2278]|uniref:histidine kinase n=1 Tax=Methanolobus tindarius DSM 2278 TaxID=1090322 RepID=W9DTU9_METTI|nr:histidine kinase N-terminal 7TM domain-containing protein [Methanolobus tindarius]ETA69228.1 PAS domain S-box [Methanolobus tindarius DSM 2278]